MQKKKSDAIIPIEISADSIEHLGSNYYYIRHIFNALREHKELLEIPDYKRLYDEAEDYLFRRDPESRDCSEEYREQQYKLIEFLADLTNKHSQTDEKYSIEAVDRFLEERRKVWNS